MRLGATSPVISIDPENEAVNWLWYCSPAYRDEDYLPAARARPGGDALAAAQWRAWQEHLWARVTRLIPGQNDAGWRAEQLVNAFHVPQTREIGG